MVAVEREVGEEERAERACLERAECLASSLLSRDAAEQALVQRVLALSVGLGPVELLLADRSVEEIVARLDREKGSEDKPW